MPSARASTRRPLVVCVAGPDGLSLPLDAVVLEEEELSVWQEETLEYNGLQSDPRTPVPLQSYLRSFVLPSGQPAHAFAGGAVPLSRFGFLSLDFFLEDVVVDLFGRLLSLSLDSELLSLSLDSELLLVDFFFELLSVNVDVFLNECKFCKLIPQRFGERSFC